jgi:DNA-binding GntR family transcriptional regulator
MAADDPDLPPDSLLDLTPVRAPDTRDWAPELQKAKVYEQLLSDIILGNLPPSAPLEEKRLALRYDCGLAGLRDAMGRLALEGLVVRRARIGTMVAPLDLREIEHAFEVRSLVEGRSGALAARHATPEDIAAIRAAFADAEAAVEQGDLRALLQMDQAFHKAVAIATHNPLLSRFIISLQNIATRYWIYAMGRQSPQEQLDDIRLHREAGEAIARRDEAAAEQAMARLVGDPPSRGR